MKRGLTAVAAALLVAAGVNCQKVADDYYPLSIGSTWNMEGYVLLGTTAASLDTIQTTTSQTKVEKQTQLSGGGDAFEVVYRATIHVRFPIETTYAVCDTSYVQETSTALLSYSDPGDTAPDTMAVFPMSAGKTWHVSPNTTAEAVGQEDLTVRAGSFQKVWKIKYSTTDGSETFDMFMFFANHVGHVRTYSETEPMQGYLQVQEEQLTAYDIK